MHAQCISLVIDIYAVLIPRATPRHSARNSRNIIPHGPGLRPQNRHAGVQTFQEALIPFAC